MQFSPDENENEMVAQAVAGCTGITNSCFRKFPLEMRQRMSDLIFMGAQVVVKLELSPHPSILGFFSFHGEEIELFKIESPPEHHPETQH